MSLSLSVLSQSGPPKSVGGGSGVVGGGGGGGGLGRIPHFNWSIYRGGNFFFYVSGLKLDEKSIENGLEGQKFLVVCLFWGGCHHPNTMFLYIVPNTLLTLISVSVFNTNS